MKKLAMLLIVILLNRTSLAQNSEPYLFTKIDKTGIALSLAEESRLASVLKREIVEQEYEIVMLNDLSALLQKQSIKVNLGKHGDVVLYVENETVDILGNMSFAYKADYKNYALITIKGSHALVFFQLADEVFNIEPLSDRYYILTKVDVEKARRTVRFEHDSPSSDSSPSKKAQSKTGGTSTANITTSNSTIDVLVAYTPAAASASGDITSLISSR